MQVGLLFEPGKYLARMSVSVKIICTYIQAAELISVVSIRTRRVNDIVLIYLVYLVSAKISLFIHLTNFKEKVNCNGLLAFIGPLL